MYKVDNDDATRKQKVHLHPPIIRHKKSLDIFLPENNAKGNLK